MSAAEGETCPRHHGASSDGLKPIPEIVAPKAIDAMSETPPLPDSPAVRGGSASNGSGRSSSSLDLRRRVSEGTVHFHTATERGGWDGTGCPVIHGPASSSSTLQAPSVPAAMTGEEARNRPILYEPKTYDDELHRYGFGGLGSVDVRRREFSGVRFPVCLCVCVCVCVGAWVGEGERVCG